MISNKKMMLVGILTAVTAVSACTTEGVVDNTVGATGYVAKTAIKGTVGAGKLAVKGVKKVAGTEE